MSGETLYYAGIAISGTSLVIGAIFSIWCFVRTKRLNTRLTREYGERPVRRH